MTTWIKSGFLFAPQSRKSVSLSGLIGLWRSRRALAALDRAALEDIGLSAGDAQREARRPIWDVPTHWRA